MKLTKIAAVPVIALAAGLSLAACGQTVTKAPATHAPAAAAPAAPAATTAPTAAASPPDTAPLSGAVGTTYQVTGPNGPSGASTVYTVTLDQVQQQATLGEYATLTNGADHVVAAEFTITGTSGQSSDDANNDAVVVGSDQQNYTPSFDTITAGTNFNSGDFNVTPGQTVTGWVAFELAPGTSIGSVQWSPGIGGQTATWTVK